MDFSLHHLFKRQFVEMAQTHETKVDNTKKSEIA